MELVSHNSEPVFGEGDEYEDGDCSVAGNCDKPDSMQLEREFLLPMVGLELEIIHQLELENTTEFTGELLDTLMLSMVVTHVKGTRDLILVQRDSLEWIDSLINEFGLMSAALLRGH
ncbi:hypothetical protein SASPL_136494 [Salvia splendens]|uniref:Uncharacterized protein n=1 Tax=Salvia splendens TaxID=180675 RepID=A0A8X8ZHK9_SALSN|nr:hypothetical protein SASPL_136494 [Salvia splendens]